MSDERKYKQRGYQDPESRSQPGATPRGPRGRRTPSFTAYRERILCDGCGTEISTHFEILYESCCPKCGVSLHICRNCLNLDPASRFECARPINVRVENKRAANSCPMFEARRVQVKETSFNTSPTREDARKALENLFKKK